MTVDLSRQEGLTAGRRPEGASVHAHNGPEGGIGLSVLVVDDDRDHVELVRRALRKHESAFEVVPVHDGLACLEALARRPYSVVLLDYSLPRMNGLEVLERIRALGISVPVVMATGQGNERIAVEAMRAGAIDYIIKTSGYFTTLPTVLNKVLKQHELARENARLYEEAHRQQARLAQIFDSTSDGIVLVDGDGRVLCANRRAGELLDVDPAQALGRRLPSLLGDGDGGPDWQNGGEGDLDVGRGWRTLHWVGQPTTDTAGAVIGCTVTLRDVTQERRVSRMKSDFVSFVAHQLRTPLSGIKWMLELAKGEADESSVLGSYVSDAALSADRLIAMMNDLLNISRLEGGDFALAAEATSLGELTAGVLEEMRVPIAAKGHRVRVSGADDVPAVVVDRRLFREVIVNLLSNAVKFTPPGGAITIRMFRSDGAVCWEIADNGIGIPRAAQSRLFEKFYRADNAPTIETEGTGLGLYLVRLILKLIGGQVSCRSDEAQGSTFLVTLPEVR